MELTGLNLMQVLAVAALCAGATPVRAGGATLPSLPAPAAWPLKEGAADPLLASLPEEERLISQSADAFNMPDLFAGVIVLAVAGIAMTAGFGWVEKKLVPWTKD